MDGSDKKLNKDFDFCIDQTNWTRTFVFLKRPHKILNKHFDYWRVQIWSHSATAHAQLPPHGLITASGVFRTAKVPLKTTEGLNLKVAQHSARGLSAACRNHTSSSHMISRLYAKDDGRIFMLKSWGTSNHVLWSLLSKFGVKIILCESKAKRQILLGGRNYTLPHIKMITKHSVQPTGCKPKSTRPATGERARRRMALPDSLAAKLFELGPPSAVASISFVAAITLCWCGCVLVCQVASAQLLQCARATWAAEVSLPGP